MVWIKPENKKRTKIKENYYQIKLILFEKSQTCTSSNYNIHDSSNAKSTELHEYILPLVHVVLLYLCCYSSSYCCNIHACDS